MTTSPATARRHSGAAYFRVGHSYSYRTVAGKCTRRTIPYSSLQVGCQNRAVRPSNISESGVLVIRMLSDDEYNCTKCLVDFSYFPWFPESGLIELGQADFLYAIPASDRRPSPPGNDSQLLGQYQALEVRRPSEITSFK